MVFAQIKDGFIQNTIILNDSSLLNLFQNDPITGDPFDDVIQIDMIYPRPGIGWTFDGIQFMPPDDGSGDSGDI